MEKETLREKIMNIISVPPDHEGGTGYLKLTDEEIDKIVKVFEQREKEILDKFNEEMWFEEGIDFRGSRWYKVFIEQKLREIKR